MAEEIISRLTRHIEEVTSDPTVPLDHKLFEEAELVLPETLAAEQRQPLAAGLSTLLPNLQQDPTPAVSLLLRLLEGYAFSDILQLANVPFTDGLAVGEHMVAFNKLILAILHKATFSATDAAFVAGMLDTVLALIRLWLCTSDPGVASQASQVLFGLLAVDQPTSSNADAQPSHGGQGLVWKRVFGDRDVYRTFFTACSLTGPSDLPISKSQRTLAQARLLEWLPKVAAMDWTVVVQGQHADVESAYGVRGGGLMDFAALCMTDTKDDVLMHRCLIDFFSDLLRSTKDTVPSAGGLTESQGLAYLIAKGLHARTSVIYLQLPGQQVDPLEAAFLYGPAANYIATYASTFPSHYQASQMSAQVLAHLAMAFDMSPAKWAHGDPPKHDLHVLASTPRMSLVHGNIQGGHNPIALLPSKATNPDVLNTLATIFHGPERKVFDFPAVPSGLNEGASEKEEAAAARALYFQYLATNPRFWSDIATHADTVALKDLALAAINCLASVITANWVDQLELELPNTIATPVEGHLAILAPPTLEYAVPYLLKPPQMFSNLVGGRGDVEGAAYRIASAKYDALKAFHARVAVQAEQQPGQGYEEILATLNKRLVEGPFTREGEVGGQVSTMEL